VQTLERERGGEAVRLFFVVLLLLLIVGLLDDIATSLETIVKILEVKP